VSQGHFRHIAGEAENLAGPVAEAGTEAVENIVAPVAIHSIPHVSIAAEPCWRGDGMACAGVHGGVPATLGRVSRMLRAASESGTRCACWAFMRSGDCQNSLMTPILSSWI